MDLAFGDVEHGRMAFGYKPKVDEGGPTEVDVPLDLQAHKFPKPDERMTHECDPATYHGSDKSVAKSCAPCGVAEKNVRVVFFSLRCFVRARNLFHSYSTSVSDIAEPQTHFRTGALLVLKKATKADLVIRVDKNSVISGRRIGDGGRVCRLMDQQNDIFDLERTGWRWGNAMDTALVALA